MNNIVKTFKYKDYQEYIETQKHGALKTQRRTASHKPARIMIIDWLTIFHPPPASILCLGCRTQEEITDFIDAGYDTKGIDLYEQGLVQACDMNNLDKDEKFKDEYYDIFISIHAIEHSWDLQSFINRSLTHCKKTFVFLTPRFMIHDWNPNRWDCIFLDFADRMLPKKETIQKIEECFQGFENKQIRISKHSITSLLQKINT